MEASTLRLKEILTGRYRGAVSVLIGLTFGGIAAVVVTYFPLASWISSDAFALLVVALLGVGWTFALMLLRSSERNADNAVEILGSAGCRATVDATRGIVVLEQVESFDAGFGSPTESVSKRATLTFEEAKAAGFGLENTRPKSLMPHRTAPAGTEEIPVISAEPSSRAPSHS